MAQTVYFVRIGIESNPLAVNYPHIWFPFKFLFSFGFPIGLYKLDSYLEKKEEEGSYEILRSLVGLLYLTVLVADIYYFFVVLRNMSVLTKHA